MQAVTFELPAFIFLNFWHNNTLSTYICIPLNRYYAKKSKYCMDLAWFSFRNYDNKVIDNEK
jgi:hypothetical protein